MTRERSGRVRIRRLWKGEEMEEKDTLDTYIDTYCKGGEDEKREDE